MKKIVNHIILVIIYGVLLSSVESYGLLIDTTYHTTQNKVCSCKNRKLNNLKDSILLKFNFSHSEICQLICRKKVKYKYIDSLISQNNLPTKFSFLPIVNSRFNNQHDNGAGSIGLWETNYIYGLHNGLIMNNYIDERKDPFKSTVAAVNQLKSFREKYNDANWAILAFWSSPSYVNRIHKITKSQDWETCLNQIDDKFLDKIYLLEAVYRLDSLGIVEVKKSEIQKKLLDTIVLKHDVSFNAMYDLTNINFKKIKENNPAFLKDFVPNNYPFALEKEEKIKIKNKIDDIISYQDTLANIKPKNEFIEKKYTVEEGDYLGKIAIENKASISEIIKWNDLKNTTIYVGQKLVIHEEGASLYNSQVYQNYTVQKGDQLWSIAQNFNGLTVRNILEHNNIDELKEGTILKIVVK